MPDSKAGSWGAINGQEFVNAQRTISYIQNFSLPITIDEDCWCPSILDLLADCPPTGTGDADDKYTYPSEDPAPWYDPAIPESGDFLGFLTTEFEGLGSTYTRSTFDVLSGGAVLGKLRAQARTLTWRGYLFGRTCCAAEYGLRWLTAQLSAGGDCCEDNELDVLICCPSITGDIVDPAQSCQRAPEAPDLFSCDTPREPINDPPPFAQQPASDAFRTFHKVGLFEGPIRNETRTMGCGSCEDTGTGCMINAEFTLIAGNPFQHRDPVCVCDEVFTPCTTCNPNEPDPDDNIWSKITTVTYPATEEDSAACKSKLECTGPVEDCNIDPDCPLATLPEIPAFVDPCGCDALFTTDSCCIINNDVYGKFFEGVPQFKIFSGDSPLRNVTIRIYENPQERTCDDDDMFDVCNLCDTITVRYIPANSTLLIDGMTKRVSIECPGNNIQPAESLLVSNYRWPVLKCVGYIARISADCCGRPPVNFVRSTSNGVNVNTFNGQVSDVLHVRNTGDFPATGFFTLETGTAKVTVTYTGKTPTAFTGVSTNGNISAAIATGDRIVGQSTDEDCTQGVAANARFTVLITPREM